VKFYLDDPDNLVEEVHEHNNKAWTLIRSGFNSPTGVEGIISDEDNPLLQNHVELFPNPVQYSGTFKFSVESTALVELSILDRQGRLVDILFSEIRTPGIYHQDISVDRFNQGIYFYRFKSGKYVEIG